MSVEIRQFEDREELAERLADAILRQLQFGLNERGFAFLAVSGGTTPRRLFEVLAHRPFAWDKVAITLVDERWVPENSARSNARAVRSQLLQGHAAAATFRGLYSGAATPEAGIDAVHKTAGGIAEFLDAAVLGMGTDGHTASLFPGGDNLQCALDARGRAQFMAMNAPGTDEPRITMTAAALLKADTLFLHIEGAEKRAVLDRALAEGAVEEMPVRALVNHRKKLVTVFYAP